MVHKHVFPKDFIWGTATSAHQTEGNNTNSDWWEWEQKNSKKKGWPREVSGIADDSYNRFEEDFDLCVKLNNNAVRISVEWARIEPSEGVFSEAEIEHYRRVLKAAKKRNLKTYVTLHHFTNPIWFSKKGGWTRLDTHVYFARYAKKCAESFGNLVDAYMTINEPQVLIYMGYFRGLWPPQKMNPFTALLVQYNMHKAHIKAYNAIKSIRSTPVAVNLNIVWYEKHPHVKNYWDFLASALLNFLGRDFYIRPVTRKVDFIALNYYTTIQIKNLRFVKPEKYQSDMGWWINPRGLENILVYLKRYKVPVYITENGIADAKDELRGQFIRGHLMACARALERGANLKGYFHWSLLDNYEWSEGYWPKFGLVEIDRKNNFERKPRMSFYYYADICKNNAVEH